MGDNQQRCDSNGCEWEHWDSCGYDCQSNDCCGSHGDPCCSGNACASGHLCISGTCYDEPNARKTTRYYNPCTYAHWQAYVEACYPGPSASTGCSGCGMNYVNGGGCPATCWDGAQMGFWTYDTNPSFGSFFKVYHCFVNGGNRYQKSSCGSSAGHPADIGYIASSPVGIWDDAIYLCQWSAQGVTEHFFSYNTAECGLVGGTIVGGGVFGYVVP